MLRLDEAHFAQDFNHLVEGENLGLGVGIADQFHLQIWIQDGVRVGIGLLDLRERCLELFRECFDSDLLALQVLEGILFDLGLLVHLHLLHHLGFVVLHLFSQVVQGLRGGLASPHRLVFRSWK